MNKSKYLNKNDKNITNYNKKKKLNNIIFYMLLGQHCVQKYIILSSKSEKSESPV